jgi:multiple sugar transport system permease protein
VSLLLLAGLVQVPDEQQQAAMVDGATWWQRFMRVTLPNMWGAITVALLFRAIDAFRIFDNVFIMTAGAQKTETVSILAYRQTISRAQMGLGSAVSILLFVSVLLICVLFIKVFRADVGRVRDA